jgi:hypothetical protein
MSLLCCVLISLIFLRQIDIKSLIDYSYVANICILNKKAKNIEKYKKNNKKNN